MMTRMTGSGNDNTHIYTADDERLWTMDFTAGLGEAGTVHTFRLRDADDKALRELRLTGTNLAGNWSFRKDYIHRDAGRLLASVAPGNVVNHFTLDHLGTPRLLTNNSGGYVSDHHYFAYGEELTPQTSDALKFTGHERDFNEGGGIGISDDLDYMHRRYCSPVTGRFLSFDPVMQTGRAKKKPGLWNRYAYALGNPMNFIDPKGEDVSIAVGFKGDFTDEQKAQILAAVADFWKKANVGKVFVFDSAKFNETNTSLFGFVADKGTASITVSSAIGTSKPDVANVGDILKNPYLSSSQVANAVANRVNHEVFTHQFGLTPTGFMDPITFDRAVSNPGQAISSRYGTIADSQAFNSSDARDAAMAGPLPTHAADLAQAQRELGGISLNPPSPRN